MKFFAGKKQILYLLCLSWLLASAINVRAQSPCLISQWNFTGNANDSKGTNHGTASNTTLVKDRFSTTNAAYLFKASSSSYVSIPYTPFALSNYSYSVWVKLKTHPPSGGAYIFLSVGGLGGDQNMQVENNQNNGAMGFLTGFTLTAYSKKGSTISTGGVCAGTLPDTGKWYHVVCTRDSNYFKVYVNGCHIATSASTSGALPHYGSSPLAKIGARQNNTKHFDGTLDDVGIYNCVLTAKEVATLYHGGKGTLLVTKDTTICLSAFKSFKLKASSGFCSYKWIDVSNRSSQGTDSHLLIKINKTTTFRVFNDMGDSATVKVTILPNPAVNLGKDTAYCGNFNRILDAKNPGLTYSWNTGKTTQTIVATAKGWYGVKVTDAKTCFSTDSIYLDHHPLPKVNLGNDTLICGAYSRVLDAGNPGYFYLWNTGETSKTKTVNDQGIFGLKVTDSFGCIGSDSIQIKNPRIKAAFQFFDKNTSGVYCTYHNGFTFFDKSTYTNDSRLYTDWYPGDGSSVFDTILNKTYYDTGTFVVKHLIRSSMGCRDSSYKTVKIFPSSDLNFSINDPDQCLKGNSFNFTNSSQLIKGSHTFQWSLGNGSTFTTKDVNAFSYSKDTAYTIRLISTTDKNCKDTLYKTVTVFPDPTAGFNIVPDKQCFRNNLFNFNNTSTLSKGTITQNIWEMGDGNSLGTMHVSNYNFSTEDTFQTRLIVISDKGCRDTIIKTAITYAQPSANFSVSADSFCWHNANIFITNNSGIKYGTLTDHWDFDDGSTSSAITPPPKKYNNSTKNYALKHRVTSEKGCTDSVIHMIMVYERPLSAFSVNDSDQCQKSNLFKFTNGTSFSNMGSMDYLWDYGDGSSSFAYAANNIYYTSSNFYTVRLIAHSGMSNCYDTSSRTIYVAPHAVPDFTINNDSQCQRGNAFVFTNTSTLSSGTQSYLWHMGDGSKTTATNVSRSYPSIGSRWVKLVSTTDHLCMDSIEKSVTTLPHPKAGFTVNDSLQCKWVNSYDLTNTSSGHAASRWDLDDGSNSLNTHIYGKKFAAAGLHKILLSVSSVYQCKDSVTKNIFIEDPRTTTIQIGGNDSQCFKGNNFGLSAKNSNSAVTLNSYAWDLGDGSTSALNSINHSYTALGTKNIRLEVSSINGCKDTAFAIIQLMPHPVSSFTNNSPCFPESAQFYNISTIVSGNIKFNNWALDENSFSTLKDPVKKYSKTGFYNVQLISTSDFGCKDTANVANAVYVRPRPNALFTFTRLPDIQFGVALLQFNNQSSADAISYDWDFGNNSSSTDKDPLAQFDDTNNVMISLKVVNAENCADTFYMKSGNLYSDFKFFLPNVFTPDGNGLNELFKPVLTPYVNEYSFKIFNAWGEKVFESFDVNAGWDGTYMGRDCMSGTYVCQISLLPKRGTPQYHSAAFQLFRKKN